MLQKGKERNEAEINDSSNTTFNRCLWSTYMPRGEGGVKEKYVASLKVKKRKNLSSIAPPMITFKGGNPTA